MLDRPYEITAASLFIIYLWIHWRLHSRLVPRFNGASRMLLSAASFGLLAAVALGMMVHVNIIARNFPAPYYPRAILRALATLWVFCSVAGFAGTYLLALLFRRPRAAVPDPVRRRLLRTAAAAAPFAAIGYGVGKERTDVRREEVEIPVEGLHHDLERLRMVQISDIHLSPTLSEAELARMVDMVNELRADLIFVTGDLITKQADPLELCLRQLRRLKAGTAVAGCMGNHETYAEAEDYLSRVGPHYGVDFLRYQNRQFRFGGATLNIAGVDYEPLERGARYLAGCERLLAPDAVNILLSHNPDVLPVAARQGFDVTLAGHMHGGQVNVEILHPWGSVARFYSPYVKGLYGFENNGRRTWGYVNRGLGTIGVPMRFGAPPEITIIRLKRAERGPGAKA